MSQNTSGAFLFVTPVPPMLQLLQKNAAYQFYLRFCISLRAKYNYHVGQIWIAGQSLTPMLYQVCCVDRTAVAGEPLFYPGCLWNGSSLAAGVGSGCKVRSKSCSLTNQSEGPHQA